MSPRVVVRKLLLSNHHAARCSGVVIAMMLAGSLVNAATLYWDGGTVNIGTDGNGVSGGTTGNWNTSLTNWDQGAGLAHIAWDNTNTLLNPADTAVFGGTAGTVTIGAGGITVGGLTFFSNSGYTLTAGSNGLNFGAANNTINLINVSGTTSSATISGTVSSVSGGNVILNSNNPFVTSTLTFNGTSAGGWSGSTTINPNFTLLLSGSSQVLVNTSDIKLNGGNITLTNASGEAAIDRVKNDAAIVSTGGGTITMNNTAASAIVYAETIGNITHSNGQLNFVLTNNQGSGGGNMQTLTLGTSGSGLSRSGTATLAFSSGGNLNTTTNIIRVYGVTSSTTAGQIIGPWATTGTGNAVQTDYAVYNSDGTYGRIVGANISASAQSTWTTTHASTSNYTLNMSTVTAAANGRLTASRYINSLRGLTGAVAPSLVDATTDYITIAGNDLQNGDVVVSRNTPGGALTPGRAYYVIDKDGAGTGTFRVSLTSGGSAVDLTTTATGFISAGISLNGNTLGTYGILNGSSDPLAIGGGSGSSITLPTTTSGNLYVMSGNASVWIDAPITNNGAGVLTLVTGGTSGNGSGNITLTGANTYTGGTVINSGILSVGSASNIGGSGADLTFGGTGTLTATGTLSGLDTLTVNQGAVGTFLLNTASTNVNFATTTGSGTLVVSTSQNSAYLNLGDASGFTGTIQGRLTGNANIGGSVPAQILFSDIADTAGSAIQIGGGQSDGGQGFRVRLTGDAGPLVFDNREIQILSRVNSNWTVRRSILENYNTNAANTWVINTDLVHLTDQALTFELDGTNTGNNAFNGRISNGNLGGTISLQKSGSGRWILGGNNTYTGTTNVTNGTLLLSGTNQTTGNTRITGGTLVVNTLPNGGVAGSLGTSSAAAGSIQLAGGTLQYAPVNNVGGTGETTDRNFSLVSSSTIDASGTGALVFGQTGVVSPDATSTANFASGQKVVTGLSSTANLAVGMRVTGNLIGTGSANVIASIDSATQITLVNNVSGVGSGVSLSFGYNTARTLTLTGTNTGANTIAGMLQNSTLTGLGVLSLAKSNVGTWVLSGENTATGTSSISGGGSLVLDYSGGNTSRLPSGILTLAAGNIILKGGSYTQGLASTTITTGGGNTHISHDGGSSKIALGAITRNGNSGTGGNTLSLEDGTVATTTSTTVNGILSGGITVGDNWAKVDGSGNIIALTSGDYTAVTASATTSTLNYQLTGSMTRSAAMSLNSLRITGDGDDQVLDLGTNNLRPSPLSGSIAGAYVGNSAAGGILYTGGGNGNYTITGSGTASIAAQNGNQELIINTYAGALNVEVPLTMGASGLTKTGAGTLVLKGANTYTGFNYINAGMVQFAKQTSLYNNNTANWTAAKIVVQNGATLAFNVGGTGEFTTTDVATLVTNLASSASNGMLAGSNFGFDTSNASGGTFTIADVIADTTGTTGGARGLIKLGSGKLVLTNTSNYTGATTVSGGILAVNGSLTATSGVTVANTATLQGSGTISSSVTIQNGGTLATGNSIESLATGALSLNSGSTFAYEMNNNVAAGVAGDLTAVTGGLTLALDNLAVLTLSELGAGSWTIGEKLTLISYTGTWNGGLFSYSSSTLADDSTFNFSGIDWTFNYNDTSAGSNYTGDLTLGKYVTMTAVAPIPEPGVALLSALGVLGLLLRRRRD